MRTISVNYVDFGPVVQDISFEYTSYLELYEPLFRLSKSISAILVEGVMWNISVVVF